MPRKPSGTSAKANAKGGASTTNATPAADGSGAQMFENQIVGNPNVTTTTTAARGGSATRGAKRRRTSNNVNSSLSGNDVYGSGTIVASNPFDDDNLPISTVNHNVSATSKMMMSPSMNQLNMHQSMHHQSTPPHPLQPPQHHHQHQHHPHHQQPMHHHNQPMYSHPHQNNHLHYQHPMQQPMSLQPAHGQMGGQPNHLPPGSLALHPHQTSPQQPQQIQQQMHSDHLGGPQPVQPMHNNHGAHMIPAYSIPPPPPSHVHPNHQLHQPQHHQQQQSQQQQPQMIGSSTPPVMMGGPAPTHSPYNPAMQQGHMMQQPHPAMTPQGQPPQQQQPPPSHHQQIDPMNMQQHPHPASNHISYCGKCQREVYRNEAHIICKAGCKSLFHISCSGLTQLACDLLMKESLAEWACDRCMTGNRRVPYIKYKT
jgi:hypothetical protein